MSNLTPRIDLIDASIAPRDNILINGDMRVNQRGLTPYLIVGSASYTIDRWRIVGNLFTTRTISQETTDQPPQLSGSRSHKDIWTGVDSVGKIGNDQPIEDLSLYIGKTLTFSAYVKSNNSNARMEIGTLDPAFTVAYSTPHSGSGNWEKLTVTRTIPSGITGLYPAVRISNGIANGDIDILTNDFIEFTGAKLELGSIATDFVADSFGESLRKCQRYAVDIGNFLTNGVMGSTFALNAVLADCHVTLPVTMRESPVLDTSVVLTPANFMVQLSSIITCTTLANATAYTTKNQFVIRIGVASGLIAGSAYRFANNSVTTNRFVIEAEL